MSEQLNILRLAHDLISARSEESIDLNSYGNEKRGCVATVLCTSPEFNALGLLNRAKEFPETSSKHPYPITKDITNFAPDAIRAVFQDLEAFSKYCSAYGCGKWDHQLVAKGDTSVSHKKLALLRLERGIKDAEVDE